MQDYEASLIGRLDSNLNQCLQLHFRIHVKNLVKVYLYYLYRLQNVGTDKTT